MADILQWYLRWKGYYSLVGEFYLQIDVLNFFKGKVSVHQLDKEFCFVKPKHFFIMFSDLYQSFFIVADILCCFQYAWHEMEPTAQGYQ